MLGVFDALTGHPAFMVGAPAVAATVLVYGIVQLVRDLGRAKKRRVDERLMGRSRKKQAQEREAAIRSVIKKEIPGTEEGGFFGMLGRTGPIAALQQACLQADLDWNAARLVVRMLFLGAVLGVGMYSLGLGTTRAVLAGVFVPIAPVAYIIFLRKRRLNALVDQLPDAFDMIGQALRAGQALPAAIGLVAEQLPDPISTEFALVYQQQKLGVPLEDALGQFADRVNQMDISFFVTAVQIQRQTGGDLAEVLDNIGEIIRDRIKLFGEVRALSAEGRLSALVLVVMPPGMLVATTFLNPTYSAKLLESELGVKMLWAAAGWQFIGMLIMRKIVNIKV